MAARRAQKMSKSQPRFTAKVKTLAQDSITVKDAMSSIESNIIARIQKCLSRANHPNTPEAEAQAALRMSSRLMTQYNITHTDVLENQDTNQDQTQQAGQSIVTIHSVKPDKRVVYESWVGTVARAMQIFFDCKVYSTECRSSYEWCFYGIAPNTVAAAMSFEMVYNLIWNWSLGRGRAKFSYQHGVASGLEQLAYDESRAEELRAMKQEERDVQSRSDAEQAERQKELDRLNIGSGISPDAFETKMVVVEHHLGPTTDRCDGSDGHEGGDIAVKQEEDDDSDDSVDRHETFAFEPQATFKEEEEQVIDITADFEEELRKHTKSKPNKSHHRLDLSPTHSSNTSTGFSKDASIACIKTNTIEQTADVDVEDQNMDLVSWKTQSALVVFRKQAQKIADDFINAQDFKLSNAKAGYFTIRDRAAYDEGRQDSKKVDVKRQRIEY